MFKQFCSVTKNFCCVRNFSSYTFNDAKYREIFDKRKNKLQRGQLKESAEIVTDFAKTKAAEFRTRLEKNGLFVSNFLNNVRYCRPTVLFISKYMF